jgi:hypothetical protein
MSLLTDRRKENSPTRSAAVMGLLAYRQPEEARASEERCELRFAEDTLTVYVRRERPEVRPGSLRESNSRPSF